MRRLAVAYCSLVLFSLCSVFKPVEENPATRIPEFFPDLEWKIENGKIQVRGPDAKFIELDSGTILTDCSASPDYCKSILEWQLHSRKVKSNFPIEKVTVTNFREFVQAVRPNRTIFLDADEIEIDLAVDIKSHSDMMREITEYSTPFVTTSPDVTLLANLPNLTIIGKDSGTKIIHNTDHADVLVFVRADHLQLEKLSVSHRSPYGCRGEVVRIVDSKDILIADSNFNGSGTVGLTLENVSGADIVRTRIESNSLGGLSVSDSANIEFENLEVVDNHAALSLVWIENSRVAFRRSRFENNICYSTDHEGKKRFEASDALFVIEKSEVSLVDSTIRNNEYPRVFQGRKPVLKSTRVSGNGIK